MFNDFISVIQWWFVLFLIGIIFFPITYYFLKNFTDNGYAFSKVLGTAVVSYLVFVLGTLKILPFNFFTITSVLLISACLNIFIFNKQKIELKNFKKNIKVYAFEESVFLSGIILWSYIRAFQPDINGLEKFMDFGFVNSILRSTYFPPTDMWFPPFSINYYYFGHLITAVLTKLSLLPSSISYNLMIATLFSFTFILPFSLTQNIIININQNNRYAKIGGVLAGLLLIIASNLHIIYAFFTAYPAEKPQPPWELTFTPQTFPNNNYWYPNATRFIPYTIHEFPSYSFVVSDLHGHVIDIPFVLLTIAISYVLIQNSKFKIQNYSSKFKIFEFILQLFTFNFSLLTLLAFLLAIMYMTNAWDGLIYLLLITFVLTAKFFTINRTSLDQFKIENIKKKIVQNKSSIYYLLFSITIIVVGFILFSLPFSLHFKPFVSGIGIICAPKFLTQIKNFGPFLFEANHCDRSVWWQLLILHGFFLFFIFSFMIFILKKKTSELIKEDIFILILIFLSVLLIIAPEFIYVKDIYPQHYRANTMFKLGYQAYIMLTIVSSYVFIRIFNDIKHRFKKIFNLSFAYPELVEWAFFIISILFFTLVLIYPNFAIISYYDSLRTYKGLNGTAYLKRQYPQDHEAINWLNKNIQAQPVILEAHGDSYTDYSRISANTGLPTVVGWTVHEWLWRGSYDIPAPRITDVQTIYELEDLKKTKELLKKYKVEYVYIGNLEHQKYPNLNEEKFKKLGKVVFQNGTTKIYKLF